MTARREAAYTRALIKRLTYDPTLAVMLIDFIANSAVISNYLSRQVDYVAAEAETELED